MTSACGLDFGTSNSAIGVIRAGRAELAPMERDTPLFPSAIFFDYESGKPRFGAAAIASYVAEVEGRLLRALKSILSSSLVKETTQLDRRSISFEQVITLFVGEMKSRAEAALGQPLEAVVHGRPVHFVDGDPAGDAYAEQRLAAIARRVGFREISFQYEPLAAARAFEATVTGETLALICDLGGGTSDFSVVRLSPERHGLTERRDDILASHGIRLGGTDLDRLLSLECAMPALGLGTLLHNKNLPMPRGIYRELADWPSIHQAYTPANRRLARELLADAREPETLARLKSVIDHHLGHRVALAVENAKIGLSEAEAVPIEMGFVEAGLAPLASRVAFEDAVAGERGRLAEAVRETLRRAGIDAAELGTVFLTGGSSRVPVLRRAIASVVGAERFASRDDLLSVALGLTEEARLRYA